MATKFDSRQTEHRSALPMVGASANDTLDTFLPKIDTELAKLFEDRNLMLADGGTISVNSSGTSLSFSQNLRLHINSQVAGGAPTVIDLTNTTRSFSSNLTMLYAVINRTAGTASVTEDATSLPAQTSANQEVVLIAKRVDSADGVISIYFRDGTVINAGQSGRLGQASVLSSSFAVSDASDATKKIAFSSVHANTGTTTTIRTTATGNITLTLPDANETLVGRAVQESIINKQISYSLTTDSSATGSDAVIDSSTYGVIRVTNASLASISGISGGFSGKQIMIINQTGNPILITNDSPAIASPSARIYTGTGADVSMPNNASFIFVDDTTTGKWMLVGGTGSGSGTGGINYIESNNAETGITGWSTYNDSAETPVDGTGGSANSTWTAASSDDLRDTKYFAWTKSGSANRQGEGVSYAFTIDKADRGKVLQGTFDYKVVSGTFADNDMAVWVYDVTNARLIQPTPYLIKNHSLPSERYFFEFQTSIDSVNYRLLIHTKSASTQNYVLGFDNIILGPQAKMYGSPVTDAIAYTPTITTGTGSMTNATTAGWYKRQGDMMKVWGTTTFSAASAAFNQVFVGLPSGFSIDTAKLTATALGTHLGNGHSYNNGISLTPLHVIYSNTVRVAIRTFEANAAPGVIETDDISNTNPFTYNTGDTISWEFEVPIAGWSSSQLMSDQADTRVVAASYTKSAPSGSAGANTIIDYDSKVFDTHGAVTTGASWRFTAPTAGIYRVRAAGEYSCGVAGTIVLRLFKNGVEHAVKTYPSPSTITFIAPEVDSLVQLNAGDYIDVRDNAATGSWTRTGTGSQWRIDVEKVQGPSQIMASEKIVEVWNFSSGGSYAGTGVIQDPNFNTKEVSTHGCFSGNTFTAPRAGYYRCHLTISGNTSNSGITTLDAILTPSSGQGALVRQIFSDVSTLQTLSVTKVYYLTQGQTVRLRARAVYSGSTPTFQADAQLNYICVESV